MSGHIIAMREFELAGDPPGQVSLAIVEPHQEGANWRCDFYISGLDQGALSFYAMGIDAVQALFLAMQNIASLLYATDEYKAGRLAWLGQRNLGLPTAETIAHLVPK